MTERENLANDIYNILMMHNVLNDDIKQRIVITLGQYEVQRRTTDIVPADPDDNENMIRKFMVAKAVAGRSTRTIEQYVRALRKFIRITGVKLLEATSDDFRGYLAHRMINDGIHGITLTNERCYISTFYDWAVSTELIIRNPIRMVDQIKVPKKPKQAFSELEIEKLRAACRTLKEKAIFETLLSTACRVSELLSIRTCDINENRIMVCGKGTKYAQVYLNSKAMYSIEAYINSRTDENPYLFPGRKGEASAACIQKILKQIGDRACVGNVHPHRFRRTAATMALRHGMSIEMVSKMLRHERLQTTMIYLDLDDRELQYQHAKYVG